MNQFMDRQLISQFVVIVGLCVFGWILIVQPMSKELVDLEKKLAEAKSHPMLLDQSAIETMANKMNGIRRQVQEVQLKNQFAADTSRRYSLIMNLASEHQVTIHRLDPGSTGQGNGEEPDVQVARFDMSVEGKYENLAKFLDAIGEIDGFVEPMSLAIAPKGYEQEALVDARITCEAIVFSLPKELTAMAGVKSSDN